MTLLLIQVEQLDTLRNQHGEPVLDQLVARLMSGVAQKLSTDDFIDGEYPGLVIITLCGRDAAQRMETAQELRRICAIPARIAGKAIRPEISSVTTHGILADRDQLLNDLRARLNLVSAGSDEQHPAQAALPTRIAHLVHAAPPRTAPQVNETWYQPQLDCNTGLVTGVEAITHLGERPGAEDTLAQTPPSGVETEVIATLSRSLDAMRRWDSSEVAIPTVSIRASAWDLRRSDLADSILWELDRNAIAPERLILGLTLEPGDQSATSAGQNALRRLTDAGCRVDIEYTGDMQTNHKYLRDLPIYRLRIGRDFTSGCDHNPTRKQKIRDILTLAARLRLPVMATGVDTSAEFDYLAQIGCRQVQGANVALAMPADACADFVTAHRKQLVTQHFPRRKTMSKH